ncbi:SCO family protein, partial [Halomonas marinisediminis]
MLEFFKDYKYFAIVFSILSVIILTTFYNILKVEKPLPIYQPALVNYELVDSTIQHRKKYHK